MLNLLRKLFVKKKKPKSAFDEIHKFLVDNKIPFKYTDGKK